MRAVIFLMMAVQTAAAQNVQMTAAARQREQAQTATLAGVEVQVKHFRSAANGTGSTSGGFFVTASSFAPSEENEIAVDCGPLSPLQIEALATRAARAERVSAELIRAVIRQESGDRPCAVSAKGAMGLMQLMPQTAEDLGVPNAFDPEANVLGGAKLLRKLLDRYAGDLNRSLGAYNAGAGQVDRYGGVPPFPETVNYVDTIMQRLANH